VAQDQNTDENECKWKINLAIKYAAKQFEPCISNAKRQITNNNKPERTFQLISQLPLSFPST
jgi:hypothetical protein